MSHLAYTLHVTPYMNVYIDFEMSLSFELIFLCVGLQPVFCLCGGPPGIAFFGTKVSEGELMVFTCSVAPVYFLFFTVLLKKNCQLSPPCLGIINNERAKQPKVFQFFA